MMCGLHNYTTGNEQSYLISTEAQSKMFDGGGQSRPQKEHILHNRGSLGKKSTVFIYYFAKTINYTTESYVIRLKSRVYHFACHLITYGFDVKADVLVESSQEIDMVSWANYEISQADWIIFVCSQSSYELYCLLNGSSNTSSYLDNQLGKSVELYQKIIYNRLSIDTTNKVIPVILLEEDDNILFVPPTLQDPNNILRIFEDTPFDYDNLSGHLERLISQMAGFNRPANDMAGQKRKFVELPKVNTSEQCIK